MVIIHHPVWTSREMCLFKQRWRRNASPGGSTRKTPCVEYVAASPFQVPWSASANLANYRRAELVTPSSVWTCGGRLKGWGGREGRKQSRRSWQHTHHIKEVTAVISSEYRSSQTVLYLLIPARSLCPSHRDLSAARSADLIYQLCLTHTVRFHNLNLSLLYTLFLNRFNF